MKNYKPLWFQDLKQLKEQSGDIWKTTEQTRSVEDVIFWRQKTALLKNAILVTKQNTSIKFVCNINYHQDILRIYNFSSQNLKQKKKKS